MTLEAGLTASFDKTVGPEHTADVLATGEVPALATPVLIVWCEQATVAAIEGKLDNGVTTVGMRVRVDHLLPTPLGRTVQVKATLSRVEGRRLTFDVNVSYHGVTLADGQVVRVLVDHERFVNRMTEAYEQDKLPR